MSAHTKGPWIADNNEGFSPWTIWSRMTPTGNGITPGPKIADIHGDSAEGDANAFLIAAAPELLVALQNAVGVLQAFAAMSKTAELIEREASAAIAKALGSPA